MSFLPNRNLVLVVDDDAAMLKGVKRLLRQHGYETILFSSAKAFKNHTDFESAVCVILDINLNDGSGIERAPSPRPLPLDEGRDSTSTLSPLGRGQGEGNGWPSP